MAASKHQNIERRREIFKRIKKTIKHIYDRNIQLKMVPMDAERFKLLKYMCFCPMRYLVVYTGGPKVEPRLEIEAQTQGTVANINHYLLWHNTQ